MWDFHTAVIDEIITIIAAVTIGRTPIKVALSAESMSTEHSGRTISKENAKNWTPSNMIFIVGGRLSATADFCIK
jgi:hypothetical protein